MKVVMKKMILGFMLIVGSFFWVDMPHSEAALPKIVAVRWAAQPDNAAGEKVWRYVLDFSDPVKKKPEIKGNQVLLPGVDIKAQQGKSFGSGTIPVMKIGKSGDVVALEITPKSGQTLSYKVFALAADSKKGLKERIVVEITNSKSGSTGTTGATSSGSVVSSSQLSSNGYSIQRITVDLKQAVNGTLDIDDSESGVMVVTLKNTGLTIKDQSYTVNGESVSRVRVAPDGKHTDIILPMSTYFRKGDISVTVSPGDAKKKTTTIIQMDIRQKLPDYKYSLTSGLKGKTIVIDPGHGGSDPGAVGPTKVMEKTVTLSIAKKLGDKLTAGGAKVIYTRTTDVDVASPGASGAEELHKRIEVAHNAKADLFISIHADAAISASAGGTTTYYYPKNQYDSRLAAAVQKQVIPSVGLQDRGTKEAGFYVIKKSWIPSILVETAFISNPQEEKLLNQSEFQNKMATGIYNGIVDFYK